MKDIQVTYIEDLRSEDVPERISILHLSQQEIIDNNCCFVTKITHRDFKPTCNTQVNKLIKQMTPTFSS